jgi:membrane-bound lytic murein transglycosylase MltF
MSLSRRPLLVSVAAAWVLACVAIAPAACTDPDSNATGPRAEGILSSSEQTIEPQSFPEDVGGWNQVWFGDLDEMVAARVIRAVVAFSKTNYFLEGAQQRGLSYEALELFEKEVNRQFGKGHLNVRVVIIPVARDRLLPALVEGRADLALANLTITPERQKLVDFSIPVFTGVNELVVTAPSAQPVETVEDLSGKEVVVRASSSYYESLQSLNSRFDEEGIAPIEVTLADEHLEVEDLLEMINAGLIPRTLVDSYLADFWSQVFPDITVHEDVAVAEGGQIAWAFRKDSPRLREFVNTFVQKNHKRGTLTGNILFQRYLRSTKWVENSLSQEGLRRFSATEDLFKKYGEQYQVEWTMLAALAYQESRLDQSLRSPVGAIGVMQILPSTAADPNVDIADIEVLEHNIHAGTRYLGFLRDRYFSGEELDDLNQLLLSLAAYNAGPGRVAQLRREAAEGGLDPNAWFDNVEVVAAKRIGRETVQYVGNIFKYHIAYERIVAQLEQKGRVPSGQRKKGT